MMGRQDRDQRQLFYEFSLDEMIPTDHLLRRINVFATAVLADLHDQLRAFYSDIGAPKPARSGRSNAAPEQFRLPDQLSLQPPIPASLTEAFQ